MHRIAQLRENFQRTAVIVSLARESRLRRACLCNHALSDELGRHDYIRSSTKCFLSSWRGWAQPKRFNTLLIGAISNAFTKFSSHLGALGQNLGLLTNDLPYEILLGRVNTVYDYRFRLSNLKIDASSAGWFSQKNRPYMTINSLGVYRLRLIVNNSQAIDTSMITKLFIKAEKYKEWKRNDAIIISQVFEWLLTNKTWNLLKNELNMYLWHQRNDLNLIKHGWLRIIMYFMIQQIIRQDLLYYCIMIALRPDHETDFIFFIILHEVHDSRSIDFRETYWPQHQWFN